jgi:nucleoside-diphosphate-sugar epimerase
MPDMKSVVVTGGAGFIGANLCRSLSTTGRYNVTAIDDLSTGFASNLDGVAAELVVGSILDTDTLGSGVESAEAVVHPAARPSVPRSIADPVASHLANATGTVNLDRSVSHDDPVNLAYGTRTDLLTVIDMLRDLVDPELVVDHQPVRTGDVAHSQASDELGRKLFPDVEPVPRETGLQATVDWMRTVI